MFSKITEFEAKRFSRRPDAHLRQPMQNYISFEYLPSKRTQFENVSNLAERSGTREKTCLVE